MNQRHVEYMVKINSSATTIDKIIIDQNGIKVFADNESKDVVTQIDSENYYFSESQKKRYLNRNIDFNLCSSDIYSNYDIVCVADTNTSKIKPLSVSAFLIGIKDKSDKDEISYSFVEQVIGWNSSGISKPENFAWAVLISKIREVNLNLNESPKVLIIVDSDLGKHSNFNSRKEAIIDNFFLPINYTLAHATSNKAGNSSNTLIKRCESVAKAYLKELEQQ